MSFQTFVACLLSHFIMTFPSFLYHIIPHMYNRYKYRLDGPIVNHQFTTGTDIIIFIHGRNGVHSHFIPLIENLKKIGIKQSMIAINLGPNGDTSVIDDSIILHNLLEEFSAMKIILVGLSKGGLVVCDYVASYQPANVLAVITISSPLNGTLIADYFLPSSHIARIELGYRSSFAQILKERLPTNIPFFHIVPRWDHMIIPTSSASIDNPNHKSKYYLGLHSHNDITYAPEVAQFIADWIKEIN